MMIFECRILVVDDEPANVILLERLLGRAGYTSVTGTTEPEEVVKHLQTTPPDILLLDLHMPRIDGFAILEKMGEIFRGETFLPVLVLTADITRETRERALSMGAKDFVTKPFDHTEVLQRVHNLLETRILHLQLEDQNRLLEVRVKERTADLRDAISQLQQVQEELRLSRAETIERLSIAAEFRDNETAQHIRRMSGYCGLLAHRLGETNERAEVIRIASQMHDVGKIGIPDQILLKPGKLTHEEFETMKRHSEMGYQILMGSQSGLTQLAAAIAWTHHEKFDGTGYPRGLKGEQIPLEGRLAAVADVFDALSSDRVYRPSFTLDDALEIMREGAGTHFDARIIEVFFQSLDDILELKQQNSEVRESA